MPRLTTRLLPLSVGLLAATGLRAQFAEGFDSQATADVTVLSQPDSFVTYVDYSNMTVGAATFSIAEAPRRLAGSAATRGVLVQCNVTQNLASAVNIVAGATPLTFNGRYRLSFDAYINVPVPLPGGSTEQLLWGVGVDSFTPIEARNNRGAGTNGVYGWLAGENGYGTEDSAINNGDLEIADLGDTQAGEDVPFNEAFDSNSVGGPNGCAANTWVRVDIDVDAAGVKVYFNGVMFHDAPGLAPDGRAMIGYEDPFASLGTDPDSQWGLLDNFRVTIPPASCTTAGIAAQQGTAMAGEILNGGAPPAISGPLTARLRGGPVSSFAFLLAGIPAPFTIPVPLGAGCTINAEVATLDAVITTPTNGDGGAQFSLDIPNVPSLCGLQLGFQYLWLDLATPACPYVVTEGLTYTFGG